MRFLRAALLLGAATLPLAAHAAPAPAPAPAPAGIAVKPIAFTERMLANGLRVYAIRDTGTSNVSVQVWYDVGSKNDPAGHSGFAHMFEHLMFKATRNLAAENFDRLTEDVGGYNNASTNDDFTNYYEVVPANHLQRLLFAEADRLASLVVEPKSFASERAVVEEELRQDVFTEPYGKLLYSYFPAISYTRLPYARGTIGSIPDLDSSSVDDVRAFHAIYYRPDNAILVIAGNFDAAQLDQWVDRYFAGIATPVSAIPRVTATEPERTVATHYTVYEQNTPLPAVLISYPIPADRSPDMPAIKVLDAILATGDSSRLYQSLVYRDQLAQSADTILDSKQGAGNLGVYAILASGKTAAAGEAALRAQIAGLRDAPVSAAELAKAKNQILTRAIERRQTAEGKAFALAQATIIDGDPKSADAQLAAIQSVTAADVQRVARAYLRDERSASIRYLPIGSKPAGVTSDTIAVAPTVQVAALVPPASVPIVTPASDADRIAPPPPGPPVVAAVPAPSDFKLANGLRVIVDAKPDLPLVTASLVAVGGGAIDPAGRAGVGSLTADLLTKGTATRSATQIANQMEALGGSIDSNADWDGASLSVTVKTDVIAPALAILADAARHPAFAGAEIERSRAQAIDGVTVDLQDAGHLASVISNRAVFGDGPYGHALAGTPGSLKAITGADIRADYRATWQPGHAALILVGDVTPEAARTLAEAAFGDWQADSTTTPAITGTSTYPKPRVIVIDKPDAGQAGVVVARVGITRGDPAYYPATVADTVLGGGFSSRLNQEIRIKRGLAYGAGSALDGRRMPGPIVAETQTKNPTAAQAVEITVAEMKRLGTEPVPAAELEARKASLIGDFGRETETTGGIANLLGDYAVEGVPLGEIAAFAGKVDAVDPAAVQAAAAKLLDPAAASIVVVGDSKQFIDTLRKDYPALELIPVATLKLDTTALK